MPSDLSAATAGPAGDRPDLPTVMTLVADVDGWMSPGQASTLYDSATRCPAGGSIVEIGSFRGRSTIVRTPYLTVVNFDSSWSASWWAADLIVDSIIGRARSSTNDSISAVSTTL